MADPTLWARQLHPEDRERVLDAERAALTRHESAMGSDYRMLARDGRVVWFMDDAVLLRERGGAAYWHGVLYDITERKRAEAELKLRAAQQEAVARLGEHGLEGVALPELMTRAVTAAAKILGVEYGSVLESLPESNTFLLRAGVGWAEDEIGKIVIPCEGSHAGYTLSRGSPVLVQDWATEQRFKRSPDGEPIGVRSGMAVVIEGSERAFGVFELQSTRIRIFSADDVNFVQSLANVLADAIERHAAEEEIRRQALHDPLTRLPNRVLFVDRLSHALAQSRRRRSKVGVLFLDLDHFKLINDSLGHAAGDDLLMAVAPRLKEALRPGDTVARFGGDEFGVLVEDLTDERDAVSVAEHIGAIFTRPFILNGVEHFVTSSIGIAIAHDGGERPDALIRDADAAMYRAKERGRGRYELFDQVMRARALERLKLENELRRALGRDELTVHYQPVVSLRTGSILSVEALLRWKHPGRGLLQPKDFILVAEESGLIEPIGRWVLEEACRRAVEWQNRRPDAPPVGMSVNLSARQVTQRDLPDLVAEVLHGTGLDPASLSLEITESALVEESEGPIEILRQLKAMGVRLVIDDFGTGYSSLAYLKRFPLDALKVDRSFVEGLGTQQESTAIVNAVVAMAGALSIGVVAEGVETPLQLAELKRLDCGQAQGHLFAGALPAADVTTLLARQYPWVDTVRSTLHSV
jgi:diguanylate cyclase (GGDEF)-like protein